MGLIFGTRNSFSHGLACLQYVWLGRPEAVLFFGAGLGDDLLLTSVAREFKKRNTGRLVVFSQRPGIFKHNPDIARVINWGYPTVGRFRRWGYTAHVPQYARYDAYADRDINESAHFIATMCRKSGVQGKIALRPYIYLTNKERKNGKYFESQAVIHTAGLPLMKNKEWLTGRYQEVASAMAGRVQWIQLGMKNDPPVNGALDLRGKTTLRESAAVLSQSGVFLGQAGLLMHLARAVDCRSVIVYGGREDPSISGYVANRNIIGKTECSPCWQRTRCDYDRECMKMITVDEVIAAVETQLARQGEPLPVETAELP